MKYSIKKQLAMVLIGLVVLVLVVFLLINSVFLEKYYTVNKEKDLINLYTAIERMERDGTVETIEKDGEIWDDNVKQELRNLIEKSNIDFIILNSSNQVVLTSSYDTGEIRQNLIGLLLGQEEKGQLVEKKDNYEIRKTMGGKDGRTAQYLEMWGYVGDDYSFIMQSPLESIRESAALSSQFMIYVGIIMIIAAAVIAWLLSKRIADPILELTQLSKKMARLDFEARYTGGGNNEIGVLGENFNTMSEKLEQTVSELKTANNELQQDIEKKEKIETMRTEFLGNVSHELKTPIALIQGYAEGLKEGVNDDPESREFYCDVIVDEAGKMNQMVKNLLTLNQLEFGEEDVEFSRFDLTGLIAGVINSMEILIEQKGVTFSFLQKEAVYAWGDEFKIEQVIRNYVNNALNHAEEPKVVEIKVLEEDGKAKIAVFNTGKQIPEEDIPHIWEKFYKVDKARTREYGGNGIGLSIVKAIMTSLHQSYGVKNYDNGVEFWFQLDMK